MCNGSSIGEKANRPVMHPHLKAAPFVRRLEYVCSRKPNLCAPHSLYLQNACQPMEALSEPKTERNCDKWFQNLCNLANRLSRALDLPLDPPYRVWASFNPPTDKRKIILQECTVSNGGRRDGRKLPKMLARAHAKFSCKVA